MVFIMHLVNRVGNMYEWLIICMTRCPCLVTVSVKRVLSSLNYVTLLKHLFKLSYVLYYTESLAFKKLAVI